MQLPNSMAGLFAEFAETQYGCKDQTSEREVEMGRRRFFNGQMLLMTISHPQAELFDVKVIPNDLDEDVLQSWKTYIHTQASLASLNKEIGDGSGTRRV